MQRRENSLTLAVNPNHPPPPPNIQDLQVTSKCEVSALRGDVKRWYDATVGAVKYENGQRLLFIEVKNMMVFVVVLGVFCCALVFGVCCPLFCVSFQRSHVWGDWRQHPHRATSTSLLAPSF